MSLDYNCSGGGGFTRQLHKCGSARPFSDKILNTETECVALPDPPPRDVSEGGGEGGGGGVGWDPPPPRVPLWSPPKGSCLYPLGAEGAQAKFWLSASNIGKGGGGGGGKGGVWGGGGSRGALPPFSYGVRPFQYITAPPPPQKKLPPLEGPHSTALQRTAGLRHSRCDAFRSTRCRKRPSVTFPIRLLGTARFWPNDQSLRHCSVCTSFRICPFLTVGTRIHN